MIIETLGHSRFSVLHFLIPTLHYLPKNYLFLSLRNTQVKLVIRKQEFRLPFILTDFIRKHPVIQTLSSSVYPLRNLIDLTAIMSLFCTSFLFCHPEPFAFWQRWNFKPSSDKILLCINVYLTSMYRDGGYVFFTTGLLPL